MLAWSDKTKIEMFRYGDHILGIQGHPEYTEDILQHLVDRLILRRMIDVCPPSKQFSFLWLRNQMVQIICKKNIFTLF